MKSFKQKIEEKRAILKQQRIAQEQDARLLREQQEQERLERQRIAKIEEAEQWKREQALYEEQLWEEQERKRLSELKLQRLEEQKQFQEKLAKEKEDWKYKVEFKSKQKSIIQEILNGEQEERKYIISERSRIESDLANERYLAKEEQLRLELEETERLQLEEMERIEAEHIAEQEKYALWERLEKEENDRKEKERLELLRIQEEDQSLRETAEMLERIEAERIEYEHRQELIAKRQQVDRENINAVLNEVQSILSSNKESSFKDTLTGLYDYIYRLNTNEESDPWTDRTQPITILTWADWKNIPANESLIESDFKRARLLFEQDNMRAKRYHDHMWHLQDVRIQPKANDGTLTFDGIPRHQVIQQRSQLVKDLGGIKVWLDASDTSTMRAVTTSSLELSADNLSFEWTYAPGVSSSLGISGSSNLFDGNRATTCSIRNESGSYDWNADHQAKFSNTDGIFNLTYDFGADNKQVLKKIEISALQRLHIPAYARIELSENGTSFFRKESIAVAFTTGSRPHNNNSQTKTGESGSHFGGSYGKDANGSGSLDPYRRFMIENETSYQAIRLVVQNVGQTNWDGEDAGPDIKSVELNEFKLYVEGEAKPITNNTEIQGWTSKCTASMEWFNESDTPERSRNTPNGFATWNHGTGNDPVDGLDRIFMPYVQFSSQSDAHMISPDEYHNTDTMTQVWVVRSSKGARNYSNTLYSDKNNNKSLFYLEEEGSNPGYVVQLKDDIQGVIQTGDILRLNIDGSPQGNAVSSSATGSWPAIGPNETTAEGMYYLAGRRNVVTSHTHIMTTQIAPNHISGSKLLAWINGGKPFVDGDQHNGLLDYAMSGSTQAPTIGGRGGGTGGQASNWGDWRLHEYLAFDRNLDDQELNTVHEYLRDKWLIPYGSGSWGRNTDNKILMDYDGTFAADFFAMSSSNSDRDRVTLDANGNWQIS